MKSLTLLSALLLIVANSYAQHKASITLGAPAVTDFELTKYDKAPNAGAVILYEFTRVNYEYEYDQSKYYLQKVVRIKILSKAGLDQANIAIPYYSAGKTEELKDFAGSTINVEDGKTIVHKVEKSDIFKVKNSKNVTVSKIAFNNVKVGSILEYKYTIERDAFLSIPTVYIQNDLPVLKSEVVFDLPEILDVYHDFVAINRNYVDELVTDKFLSSKSGARTKFAGYSKRYIYNDVLPFDYEVYMNGSKDNYSARIESSIKGIIIPGEVPERFTDTWSGVSVGFKQNKFFWGQLKKNIKAKELIDAAKKIKNERERLQFVVAYVRKNIKWNGESALGTESVTDIWDQKTGNDGGINLLTINLLKEVGIEATTTLGSTHENGNIRMLAPDPNQFDKTYITAKVNDSGVLFDASDKYTPIDVIPFDILGTSLFTLIEKRSLWTTPWSNEVKQQQTVLLNLQLTDAGEVTGNAYFKSFGYAKIKKQDEVEKSKDDYLKTAYTAAKKAIAFNNLVITNDGSDNLSVDEKAEINHKMAKVDSFYLLNPGSFFQIQKNPFVAKKRKTGLNFKSAIHYKVFAKIQLPEGWKLAKEVVNEEVKLSNDDIVAQRIVNENDGELFYTIEMVVEQPLFPADIYDQIQAIYTKIEKWVNEPLILKAK